jgi:sec-independent protein translocase protein TatC
MSDKQEQADELAGTEQPFVQHLKELRDRLLYCLYGIGVAMALLAIWPGPSGLIDLIAVPIRAHMPPDVKLIAVGVFTPFFVPIKVLMMAGLLLALPWVLYQIWAFVAPGLYKHEKRFALPLIIFGSFLAYVGIAFVQFFVLDKMFGFIQNFTPESVNSRSTWPSAWRSRCRSLSCCWCASSSSRSRSSRPSAATSSWSPSSSRPS